MKYSFTASITIFYMLFSIVQLFSQTFDLQFVLVTNNGTIYEVKIQIKSNGSTFKLGSSNLVFDYNNSDLDNPTLQTAHNYDSSPYNTMTATEAVAGRVSVNIDLAIINNGVTVPLLFLDVATIRFDVLNPSGSSNLVWRTSSPSATVVFKDDEVTEIPANNLNNRNDQSLPVELSAFSAQGGDGLVTLNWTTQSEINNAGFEVYRTLEEEGNYDMIASYQNDQSLEGAGNSNTEHNYQFEDFFVVNGAAYWYKIADVDFSGVRIFHGPLSAVPTGSDSALTRLGSDPSRFFLHPNYPNPFNPETTLRFEIPARSGNPEEIRLVIYNSLGMPVRTLFSGAVQAGIYEVQWNGRNDQEVTVTSGIYFARLQYGRLSKVRKLILIR